MQFLPLKVPTDSISAGFSGTHNKNEIQCRARTI